MKAYLTLAPGLMMKGPAMLLRGIGERIAPAFPSLSQELAKSGFGFSPAEYIAVSLFSSAAYFCILSAVFLAACRFLDFFGSSFNVPFLLGAAAAVLVMFQNMMIPRMAVSADSALIERSLLSASRDMLSQLNSGVPLFDILVSVANGRYGAVSSEFRKAVREISSGKSQTDVLERIASDSPSPSLRKLAWQILNAMKSGGPLARVFEASIGSMSEEQAIKIQRYGSSLSVISMIYMLNAIIAPALMITVIVVLTSFFSMAQGWASVLFFVTFLAVVFCQLAFIGLTSIKRAEVG